MKRTHKQLLDAMREGCWIGLPHYHGGMYTLRPRPSKGSRYKIIRSIRRSTIQEMRVLGLLDHNLSPVKIDP